MLPGLQGVYYSYKKEARENQKRFHPSPPCPPVRPGKRRRKKVVRIFKDMLHGLQRVHYSCKGERKRAEFFP